MSEEIYTSLESGWKTIPFKVTFGKTLVTWVTLVKRILDFLFLLKNSTINPLSSLFLLDSNTVEAQQENVEEEMIENSKQVESRAAEKKKKQPTDFAQVSQDMSELVYHLNTIQNDISELAGRPISLTKIEN